MAQDAFDVLHFIVRKRLARGKLAVIDATNVQPEARKPFVQMARDYHCLPVAIVFDVTGLPDTSKVKEVRRLKVPENPGGFHNLYTYKHSDGRVLLFSTSTGPFSSIWDMSKFVGGAPDQGFIDGVRQPSRDSDLTHA